MLGGKACLKQPRDTAEENALPLLQLQALHHIHMEATRLFLMVARLGFTDAQIVDALRKGLPKLNEIYNAFTAALGAVPVVDWWRTWAAGRTIMLRKTSKRVKEVVDKMRLPAVIRLSRSLGTTTVMARR